MAYTLNIDLALGSSQTGLTLLAQLVTSAGANQGNPVSTGFSEIGEGTYLWTYSLFPNDFRGGVKFYESGVPATTLAFISINPEEIENPDIKTSALRVQSIDALKSLLKS